ncbi:MAG TPA: malonate decarboxylase holo-[acyl-carrier-protein] synthase [Casimicrobiaceae bacterium]|nr:malonate decarboxylase holo-[acyl-carrier-protein] synthase [Casimicrobiaceae bacterium]
MTAIYDGIVLARHMRVWPTAFAWASMADGARDPTARAAIGLWSARGWPLVVRRPDDGGSFCADENISVGLALPPALGKGRLKFKITSDGVKAQARPLALDDVVAAMEPAWQRALGPLARDAASTGVTLRVFGSAAWQTQTGLVYLHERSDIDVLVEPANRDELDTALALFERFERQTPVRLDGEIVFPGGGAVAWREWATSDERVLAKSLTRAALVPKTALAEQLDRVPA